MVPVGADRFSDEAVYAEAGYGLIPQLGRHPALIVVDVTYEFCGREPATTPGVDPRHPKSAGPSAWRAIQRLQTLIPAAREAGVPIVYSRNRRRTHPVEIGGWRRKTSPQAEPEDLEIVSEVSPTSQDLVVEKTKPSAFFGTPLSSWLTELGIDTALVAGGTTSGCVRATVTDAFSHNLRTFVVHDAVFDRHDLSHQVNLFEMQQKYAGLIDAETLLDWFVRSSSRPEPM